MADLSALEQQYGLPAGLLSAVQQTESGGNPNAISPAGALGLFQFLPSTAKQYGIDPLNPDQAAQGAAQMYSDLLGKYNGDLPSALAAYNWGQGNVDRKGLANAPAETQGYISKIMGQIGSTIIPSANASEMPNLDHLSDDQLQAIADGKKPAIATDMFGGEPTKSIQDLMPNGDLSHLSDEQLQTIADGKPSPQDLMGKLQSFVAEKPEDNYFGLIPAFKSLGRGALGMMQDIAGEGQPVGSNLNTDEINALFALSPASAATTAAKPISALSSIGKTIGEDNGRIPPSGGLSDLVDNGANPAGQATSVPPAAGGASNAASAVNGAGVPSGSVVAPAAAKMTKAQSKAEEILLQALKTEGIDPADVATSLEKTKSLGLPLRALDLVTNNVGGVQTQGRNILGLADAAANMPGEGAKIAGDIAMRGQSSRDRLATTFDKFIGGNDFYGMANVADEEGKAASPLYQGAFKANQNMASPKIDRILSTPAGQKALAGARESMLNEMDKMGVADPELTQQAKDAGLALQNGGVSSGLKMRTLDYVKQELDAQARAMKQSAATGNATTRDWTRINDLATGLRSEMDKLDVTAKSETPGLYAQARKQAATKPQMQDALEQGRGFMKMDPEEIQAFMQNKHTSQPEKMSFTTGVRRSLQDTMDSLGDNAQAISRVWKENIRDRLKYLSPSDKDLANFSDIMNHEQNMARNNNVLARGSQTFSRAQYADQITANNPTKVSSALRFALTPKQAAVDAGAKFLDSKLQKSAEKMTNETAGEIMKYLGASHDQAGLWRALATRVKK